VLSRERETNFTIPDVTYTTYLLQKFMEPDFSSRVSGQFGSVAKNQHRGNRGVFGGIGIFLNNNP
jgi:hypothetical protein